MRPTEKIDELFKRSKVTVSAETDKKMIADALTVIKQQDSLAEVEPGAWRIIMQNKFTKLAAAAIIIVAALAGINKFGGSIDGSSVAWADVVEKFRSMSFYSAVLYFKEDAAAQPKQIELWVSSQHKARLRVGNQVLFAEKGKIVAGYDFVDQRVLDQEQYDEMGEAIQESLCKHQSLSLDNIVQMVSKGKLQEVTPNINSDAMISEDLLVFDLASTVSPEWMRIWTLRQSKLPVRLRMWDPRDGECMDVTVTYEKQQPAEFFDHQKYEGMLKEASRTGAGVANQAYAFLKDPGGRNYVPQDLFNKSGYHMPQVQRIGMTEKGAVWVVASKAKNNKPDGRSFFGFSNISDDLGRKYRTVASSHRTMEDISMQIFVPEDYPFDKRMPTKITLTCNVETYRRNTPVETIGTVGFTEWQQNTIWPKDRIDDSELDIMLIKASRYVGKKQYDKYESIKKLIENSPESKKYDYKIQQLELEILMHNKQFSQAADLAEELWLIGMEKYKTPQRGLSSPFPLVKYLVAIAANDGVDRAIELSKELRETKPNLSAFSKQVRRRLSERLQGDIYRAFEEYISEMFNDADLSLEQVNKIVGFDVLQNETTKWSVPWEYRRQTDPDFVAWNKHLQELAKHYKKHPMKSGQMELRKRDKYNQISVFKLPDMDDYHISPIGGKLSNYIKHYKYPDTIGGVKFECEFNDVELQHELIVRGDVSYEARHDFVLTQFGLKMIEGQGDCEVWIAEYDGRDLPDYTTIKPIHLRGTYRPGSLRTKASGGIRLKYALSELRGSQDVIIENQTGLSDDTVISEITLNFDGKEGAQLAKKWYKDNFGITFRKETRSMPIWIVRKKEQ